MLSACVRWAGSFSSSDVGARGAPPVAAPVAEGLWSGLGLATSSGLNSPLAMASRSAWPVGKASGAAFEAA
eukprot:5771943-Alexandrium_andersonii.AAC.1